MKKKQIRRLLTYALLFTGMMSTTSFAQTDIHVLDVDQGLSVLIESQGHYMLYDGGDSSKSSYVVSYLQKKGITSLDYVVASHYDSDHLNGIVGALNVFPTANVWGPDYTADTKVFQSFQSIVSEKKLTVKQPSVGSLYKLGDASIQVLSPSGDDYSDVNNYSIAIRIQDGDTSFLITGDAESESEEEMVSSKLNLDSDVYIMGHHGSGTSTSWDLLQQSTPEYAILSCGDGNSYGHPHIESMEKLEEMEIHLFRTDKQGTIVASTDGKTITWNIEPCDNYTPGDKNDQPAQPQKEYSSVSSSATTAEVYWTPNGKSYHSRQSCSTLKRSKTILNGSLNDAFAAGKLDPCNICVK